MPWEASALATLSAAREVDAEVPAPGLDPIRVPIWIVAVRGELFTRSWKGEAGRWYRRARRHELGTVGGHSVRFVPVPSTAEIDAAYREKYGDSPYVTAMTTSPVSETTLRLDPGV